MKVLTLLCYAPLLLFTLFPQVYSEPTGIEDIFGFTPDILALESLTYEDLFDFQY